MKIKVKKPVEIEVSWIRIEIPMRYEDEDVPYDFPLRKENWWRATVDLDTGKIHDWPQGVIGRMQTKVCDEGIYTLVGPDSGVLDVRRDYVPNGVVPGEYGDYVDLQINEDGVITNWPKKPNLEGFFQGEED